MRSIYKLSIALLAFALSACTPDNLTDSTKFAVFYNEIGGMRPGDAVAITPSYIGAAPTDFAVYQITKDGALFYNPKLDGPLTEEDTFYIDPLTGAFAVRKTKNLLPGIYLVSVSCTAGGERYEYPDLIKMTMLKEETHP